MITEAQVKDLTENETALLTHLRANTPADCTLDEAITEGRLHVRMLKHEVRNIIDVWYVDDLMVLNIGEWTHEHPNSLDELTHIINRIVQNKIVVWKVTRPNGYWYSGHYDLDELKIQGPELLDEPDSDIETGDHLQKETYDKLLEDRVIE